MMASNQYVADLATAAAPQASQQHPAHAQSVIQWCGIQQSNSCGYCNSKRRGERVVAGFVAKTLTVYAYQQLLDRGWRRSGTYVYLSYPDKNCCPAYTIRLHAPSFRPSAAQKKSLRRFQNFISGEWTAKQHISEQQRNTCDDECHGCTAEQLLGAAGGVNVDQHALSQQGPRYRFSASPPEGKKQGKKGASQPAATDSVPEDMLLTGAAPTAATWRSAAKSLAKRCNDSVYAAAHEPSSSAPAALLNVLVESSENVMLDVKWTSLDPKSSKPAEVDMNAVQADAVNYTPLCIVHLYSSVCWKAASRYLEIKRSKRSEEQEMEVCAASKCQVQAAVAAEQPAAPVSKKKAKKAKKLALRASAKQNTSPSTKAHEETVSSVAEEMGSAVLPVVQCALKRDEMLSELSPKVILVRGHIHVTLRIPPPAKLREGIAAELKNLFAAAGRSSHNSIPPEHSMHDVGALVRVNQGTQKSKKSQHACEAEQVPATTSMGDDANAQRVVEEDATQNEDAAQTLEVAGTSDEDASSEDNSESCSSQDTRGSCEHEAQGADSDVLMNSSDGEQHKWWLDAPPPGGWQFRTVMQPSTFIEQEYQLYKKYQIRVHDDNPKSITRSGYKRFLVSNPFDGVVSQSDDPDAPECGYGAFHQQWWIGDHLVAICVVDVLPRCLSSKYFIWDPDLHFLSLGRVSALKEIEWVQRAHAAGRSPGAPIDMDFSGDVGAAAEMEASCTRPGNPLQYTYLGLYIHSNQKMRYKAEYRTSELLCRSTYRWVPTTTQFLKQLDTHDGALCLVALHKPITHQDAPIPPWSLPCADRYPTRKRNPQLTIRRKKRDATSRSSNGVQDSEQPDAHAPALPTGNADSSGTFSSGSINATISNLTMPIDQWAQVLRPTVVPQLRDIAHEFFEGAGPEASSVCVLEL